jgi:hypothetical protein
LISATMAGWRRSLSMQRRRVGPMLSAGTPSRALISAYDSAGSSASRASSCWQAGAAARRLAQGRVPLGRQQVLFDRLGVIVGDDLGGRRLPGVAGSPARTGDAAAFAPGGGGQPAGKRSLSR